MRGWGGRERRVFWESVGLREHGVEVFFVCQRGTEFARRVEEGGFECCAFALRGRFRLGSLLRLRRLIQKWRPHVLTTHSSKEMYLAFLAARLVRRRPLIVRMRHHGIYPRRGFGYRFIADAIVTVTHAMEDYMSRSLGVDPGRVFTVPSGVDMGRFSPREPSREETERLGVVAGGKVVVTVADFAGRKGYPTLVRAAAKVLSEMPDAVFVLVGGGSERRGVEELVREMGCERSFRFPGYIEDIPGVLSTARLFVLPSIHEGTPAALVEAMAMKKPVVASRVGGIPEVIVDGVTGVLVEPGDSDALARAIISLLNEPEKAKAMGERARQAVEEKYSFGRMLDRMLRLYRDLSAGAGHSEVL
jgi:glycosyltransferase involved in cell wall biosynthesis